MDSLKDVVAEETELKYSDGGSCDEENDQSEDEESENNESEIEESEQEESELDESDYNDDLASVKFGVVQYMDKKIDELVLRDDPRLVADIKNRGFYNLLVRQQNVFWTQNDIKADEDLQHWQKLNFDEQFFLKNILAFFASSDMIVNENLRRNFMNEIKLMEVQMCLRFQSMMEDIHSIVYKNLITAFIKDRDEEEKVLNSAVTSEIVAKKIAWAHKWMNPDIPFNERIIAFIIFEGLFFSGSFAAIFWIAERGILPNLRKANEFISRDEGMHVWTNVMIYQTLKSRPRIDIIREIFNDANKIEIEFMTSSLPVRLIGMNADLMVQYIKYCAQRLFDMLETGEQLYEKNIDNPFSFMDRISLSAKPNFFEETSAGYTRDLNTMSDGTIKTNNTEDAFADII